MSDWTLVLLLLLLLIGLWVVRRVVESRARDQARRWGDLGTWPASHEPALSRQEADQRAEALLADHLTAEQRQRLKSNGYLVVPSPNHPGREYHIPRQAGRRVVVYEHGRPASKLCVQPRIRLPVADHILLHKLMIEGDEERYLRVANRTEVVGRRWWPDEFGGAGDVNQW